MGFQGECKGENAGGGGEVKNGQKMKVLRMRFSIVENVPTPCGSILNLFRGSQLKSGAKSKNWSKFIKNPDFPYFPVFSPLLGATVPTPALLYLKSFSWLPTCPQERFWTPKPSALAAYVAAGAFFLPQICLACQHATGLPPHSEIQEHLLPRSWVSILSILLPG